MKIDVEGGKANRGRRAGVSLRDPSGRGWYLPEILHIAVNADGSAVIDAGAGNVRVRAGFWRITYELEGSGS